MTWPPARRPACQARPGRPALKPSTRSGRLFERVATWRSSQKSGLISGHSRSSRQMRWLDQPGLLTGHKCQVPTPRAESSSLTPLSNGLDGHDASGVNGLDDMRRPRLVADMPGAGGAARSDEERPAASSCPPRARRTIRGCPPHPGLGPSARGSMHIQATKGQGHLLKLRRGA